MNLYVARRRLGRWGVFYRPTGEACIWSDGTPVSAGSWAEVVKLAARMTAPIAVSEATTRD